MRMAGRSNWPPSHASCQAHYGTATPSLEAVAAIGEAGSCEVASTPHWLSKGDRRYLVVVRKRRKYRPGSRTRTDRIGAQADRQAHVPLSKARA